MNEVGGDQGEKRLYEPVKRELSRLLGQSFDEFHLEITANRRFSNTLKSNIGEGREIIFHFLKEAAPDITGFVKEANTARFLVVEIKDERLRLDDIYQARKYAELFDAKYALLISCLEIPEELKRLSRICFSLLELPSTYQRLILGQFVPETGFVDWFPSNPFPSVPQIGPGE
jgi:hypothetical protein